MVLTYDKNVNWGILNDENMSDMNNDTVVFKRHDTIKKHPDIQVKKPNMFMKFINRIRDYISPVKKSNVNVLNRQFIDELSLHNSIRPQKPTEFIHRGSILKNITKHFGIELDEDDVPVETSRRSIVDPYHGRVNPSSPWH
jgi:hypothetical protein